MENVYDALRSAITEARDLDQAVESQANVLADLLLKRLEKVSPYRLKQLKQRLQRFNSHTSKWKD